MRDKFAQYLAKGHIIKTVDDPYKRWQVNRHKF